MLTPPERVRIGLFYPDEQIDALLLSPAHERNPDVGSAATHVRIVRAAENGGFDYVFLADGWGPLGPAGSSLGYGDPMMFGPTLAGLLIGVGGHIKIITTLHLPWFHPLHVARIAQTSTS